MSNSGGDSSTMILVVASLGMCCMLSSATLGYLYYDNYLCTWLPEITFLCTGITENDVTTVPESTSSAGGGAAAAVAGAAAGAAVGAAAGSSSASSESEKKKKCLKKCKKKKGEEKKKCDKKCKK